MHGIATELPTLKAEAPRLLFGLSAFMIRRSSVPCSNVALRSVTAGCSIEGRYERSLRPSHRVSVGRVAAAARLPTVRTTQEEAT